MGLSPRAGDTVGTGLFQSLRHHPQTHSWGLQLRPEQREGAKDKAWTMSPPLETHPGPAHAHPGRDGAIPEFLPWQGWNSGIPACFPVDSPGTASPGSDKCTLPSIPQVPDLFPTPSMGNLPAFQSRPSSGFSPSLFISRDFSWPFGGLFSACSYSRAVGCSSG